MRSFTFPLFAAAALVVTACSPSRPPCGPTTCTGCCDSTGMCQLGSSTTACGKSGIQCKACLVSETCNFGLCEGTFGATGGGFGGTGGGFATGGGTAGGSTGGGFATGGGAGGGFTTGGGAAGGFATGGGSGGGAPNPGETCATAIAMTPISATQFTATGTLTGATDDHTGTCGGAGPDLAFSFVISQSSDVTFSITAIGGSGTPVGILRRDDCSTELRCQTGTAASTPINLQPGSYRLIVDSQTAGVSGSFTATVTLSTPQPLVGDSCSTAEVLTLTGGSASASGSTDGYTQTITASACSTTGPDRFYRFSLTTTSSLSATLTPSSTSFGGLYLLGPTTIASCASAAENFCDQSLTMGVPTNLMATGLAAGTYYLVVKNLGTGPGSYSLSVTATSASVPGDTCSTAVPLTFSAGSASANGTLTGATNDRSSSCATTNVDVVYSFTATAGQVLSATVTPGSSWRPVLTLTSGSSCSAATETNCNASTTTGSPAQLTNVTLTAGGTYYLWVDSVSGSGVPDLFSLSATLSGGSSNGDTCAAPIPLNFVAGSASATGNTTGLVNDNSSTCTASSGPDIVYSFTATAGQAFSASLTPSSTFRGHLVLKGPNSSCPIAAEVSCQLGTANGSVVSLSSASLSAGTYYLWVDGVNGSAGSYSLSATLTGGSTPSGENCSTAIPLTFTGGSASVSGTTTGAVNDRTTTSCGGSGPDRVYSFTVSGTRSFTATMTPGAGFTNPILYVVGPSATCSTTTTELTCSGGASITGARTITQTLSTGTYYLWADGYSTSSGTYTISASLL